MHQVRSLNRQVILGCFFSIFLLQSSVSSPAGVDPEIGEGLTLGGNAPTDSSARQAADALTVQQLERIKSESKVSASIGQNVILNCAVQFKDGIEKPFVVNWLKYPHKLPIYIWYAGYPPHVAQGYESRVSRIGQASLNLTRVRESDQGLYECKIYYLDRRPEDKANGTWIFLDVQAPPRFLQTPAQISYVQAGDSLHLTCQAESTPAPTLRWYKNKTPIDSDSGAYRLSSLTTQVESAQLQQQQADLVTSKSHLLGAPSSGQLDLFIDNVQAGTTTGEYRCLASNSEGSVEARSQVVLAVPAIITELPKNQTRVEGERLEFPCQAKALPANITYKWLFNDKPVQQLKWFEGRYTIRRDGTLVIHTLHRDDQGQYKCQATNGLSHRQRAIGLATKPSDGGSSNNKTAGWNDVAPIYAEASAYLTVEYPARVVYSPTVQYLPLGLSGVIRCHWEALPPVLYYDWSINGKQLDPDLDNNMERLKNGSLFVRQVSKMYEGKYMCTPFNKHGTLGSSGVMEVRVAEPPEFDLKPAEFYKANLNGHIKIPCSAKAHPRATVSWRRVLSPKLSPGSATSETLIDRDESAVSKVVRERKVVNIEKSSSQRPGESAASYEEGEQQSVIIYAKLPAERSEYKNSHLMLHTLHKDDHGRYECFIENEAATLIASTMLYIEDTSPHAPTDVQAETKSWSARVSWQPGYDGGFEQSYVIWYRQVPRSTSRTSTGGEHVSAMNEHEAADFSWRSVNVQPSDATSFTVQNLTQDTNYEFYVRAKNIIGDGPRSQIISASTKRALSGALTPVRSDSQVPGLTPPSLQGEFDPASIHSTSEDEEQESASTINPNVMGIIHLVYSTEGSTSTGDSQSSASQQQQTNDSYSTQQGFNLNTAQSVEDQMRDSTGSNSSKVIRFYRPVNNKQANNNSSSQAESSGGLSTAVSGNKRPRFDQPDQNKIVNNSNNTTPVSTQKPEVADYSTAPQNVSLIKVAQGWVVSWFPPARLINTANGEFGEIAAAVSQAPSSTFGPLMSNDYLVEFREKGGAWQSTAANRETKVLLKDLKPGGEYFFRVFAIGPSGTRGSASPELKHLIPDNRRKPGGTQALSAGVVSGILFFIACIVIAVCAVNMCNKRRKKRAEKAAYVMMACPVLESHHDIAALNSNSLMKNNHTNASQSRIPSVTEQQANSVAHLAQQLMNRLMGKASTSDTSECVHNSRKQSTVICRDIRYSSNAAVPVDVAETSESSASADQQPGGSDMLCKVAATDGCNTKTTSTPIDDYWVRKPSDRKWGTLTVAASRLAERRYREATVNKLQQRGVRNSQGADADSLVGEIYSTVDKSVNAVNQLTSSQTLPRFFGQSLTRKDDGQRLQHENSRQLAEMSEQSRQHFNEWLRSQLTGGARSEVKPELRTSDQLTEIDSPPRPPPRAYQRALSKAANQQSVYQLDQSAMFHAPQYLQMISTAQYHQRSISQIEPANLTNYWMQQYTGQAYAASTAAMLRYGPIPFGTTNTYVEPQMVVADSTQQQHLGKRNSLQRSTLPLAASSTHHWTQNSIINEQQQHPQVEPTPILCPFYPLISAAQPQTNQSFYPAEHVANDEDDPLTANACLGSYKRKRRLPHIEAQFTITPPAPSSKHKATAVPSDEHDTVASGNLFVRSLPSSSETRRPPPPPPLPPGLPLPGQRREHQRLKPSNFEPLSRVDQIGANEKIEYYLRYQARKACDTAADATLLDDDLFQPEILSRVELEQVKELTFQPYHNLPHLKYTISLPLQRADDGTLLLAETSHLRCSRRGRARLRSTGTGTDVDVSEPSEKATNGDNNTSNFTARNTILSKRQLGSSSSCPAPPAEFDDNNLTDTGTLSLEEMTSSQQQPSTATNYHMPYHLRPIAADSLEEGIAVKRVIQAPSLVSDISNADRASQDSAPFYLHSPKTIDTTRPPVPPHRSRLRQSVSCPLPAKSVDLKQNSPRVVKPRAQQEANIIGISKQLHNLASSSSSSSSSSSAATTTENGGATSEALTNDHSVDEQYEFDMVPNDGCKRQREHQVINEGAYSRVVRASLPSDHAEDQSNDTAHTVQKPMECSRLYCESRRKELPLPVVHNASNELTANDVKYCADSNDLYDTVYDTVYDTTNT